MPSAGNLNYTITGDLSPLAASLKQSEEKIAASKRRIESSPVKLTLKVDESGIAQAEKLLKSNRFTGIRLDFNTADADRKLDAIQRRLTAFSKPIPISFDTSLAEKKVDALWRKVSGPHGGLHANVSSASASVAGHPVVSAASASAAFMVASRQQPQPFALANTVGVLRGVGDHFAGAATYAAFRAPAPDASRRLSFGQPAPAASVASVASLASVAAPAPYMPPARRYAEQEASRTGIEGYTSQGIPCPQCGRVNSPNATHCTRCGYRLKGGIGATVRGAVKMPFRAASGVYGAVKSGVDEAETWARAAYFVGGAYRAVGHAGLAVARGVGNVIAQPFASAARAVRAIPAASHELANWKAISSLNEGIESSRQELGAQGVYVGKSRFRQDVHAEMAQQAVSEHAARYTSSRSGRVQRESAAGFAAGGPTVDLSKAIDSVNSFAKSLGEAGAAARAWAGSLPKSPPATPPAGGTPGIDRQAKGKPPKDVDTFLNAGRAPGESADAYAERLLAIPPTERQARKLARNQASIELPDPDPTAPAEPHDYPTRAGFLAARSAQRLRGRRAKAGRSQSDDPGRLDLLAGISPQHGETGEGLLAEMAMFPQEEPARSRFKHGRRGMAFFPFRFGRKPEDKIVRPGRDPIKLTGGSGYPNAFTGDFVPPEGREAPAEPGTPGKSNVKDLITSTEASYAAKDKAAADALAKSQRPSILQRVKGLFSRAPGEEPHQYFGYRPGRATGEPWGKPPLKSNPLNKGKNITAESSDEVKDAIAEADARQGEIEAQKEAAFHKANRPSFLQRLRGKQGPPYTPRGQGPQAHKLEGDTKDLDTFGSSGHDLSAAANPLRPLAYDRTQIAQAGLAGSFAPLSDAGEAEAMRIISQRGGGSPMIGGQTPMIGGGGGGGASGGGFLGGRSFTDVMTGDMFGGFRAGRGSPTNRFMRGLEHYGVPKGIVENKPLGMIAGVAGGVGAGITALNVAAQWRGRRDANNLAGSEMGLDIRTGGYGTQTGATREQLISASMGTGMSNAQRSGGAFGGIVPGGLSNAIGTAPLIGAPLTNIAGWVSGANRDIDKRMAQTHRLEEGSAVMEKAMYGNQARDLSTKSIGEDDKYKRAQDEIDEQVSALHNQGVIDAREASGKGKKKVGRQIRESVAAHIETVRRVGAQEIQRQRTIDTQNFESQSYAQQNQFTDQRAGARAGISSQYTEGLNSRDPTTRQRAGVLLGQALGNEEKQYNLDTTDASNENRIGGMRLKGRQQSNQYMRYGAQHTEITASIAESEDARQKALRGLNLNDPAQAARAGVINKGADIQQAGLRSDRARLNADAGAEFYQRGQATLSGQQSLIGNTLAGARTGENARYTEELRTNPEMATAVEAQHRANLQGIGMSDAERKFGVAMGTQSINMGTKRQGMLNQHMFMSAEAQGVIDEASQGVEAANVELRGDENKGAREKRIAALKGSAQAKLAGLTDSIRFDNRAQNVSAFMTRGDMSNHAFEDFANLKKIAGGAGAAIDTAGKQSDVSKTGGGTTSEQGDKMITLLGQLITAVQGS